MRALAARVAAALSEVLARPVTLHGLRPVAGGSINAAYLVQADGMRCFVKENRSAGRDLFEAEADGLRAIAATCTLRVPRVLAVGEGGGRAVLVLEALALGGRGEGRAMAERLAALHSLPCEGYGWRRDNYIGATPQANAMMDEWPRFVSERRLLPQLALAEARGEGALAEAGRRLAERVAGLFEGYRPRPSLLHGDLWGGNADFLPDGTPVVFDPALYQGDREADLAMTELFGGFPAGFHEAYRGAFPLDAGYPTRRELYNLYHVLNHFNLFGGGYAAQAQQMIARLSAQLG